MLAQQAQCRALVTPVLLCLYGGFHAVRGKLSRNVTSRESGHCPKEVLGLVLPEEEVVPKSREILSTH